MICLNQRHNRTLKARISDSGAVHAPSASGLNDVIIISHLHIANSKKTLEELNADDFLGLIFNLSDSDHIINNGILSNIKKNQSNFVYIPRGEFNIPLNNSNLKLLLISYSYRIIEICMDTHPELKKFHHSKESRVTCSLLQKPIYTNKEIHRNISETTKETSQTLSDEILFSKALNILFTFLITSKNVSRRSRTTSVETQKPKIRKAKNLIDKHLNKHWTLSLLAAEVDLDKHILITGFRSMYNYSPIAYLRSERMKKAYQLLSEGQNTVIQISSLVGFKSVQNFSEAFRKYYGYPPKVVKTLPR